MFCFLLLFRFLFLGIGRFLNFLGLLALAALIGVATAGTASAQDRRQNAPGEFDFYVLSLSWSPSFCEAASERGNEGRAQAQCGGRPFSFVVHGLWPQYEHGFPDYCQRPSPRLDRNIMSSMLDLMPAPGLIFAEWDKHGTCSGLGARAYFETIRKARSAVKIPEEYLQLSEPKTVAPAEIEDAFIWRCHRSGAAERGSTFPGCCAMPSARSRASSTRFGLRRSALLIRGPRHRLQTCGSRLCGAA